MPLNITSKYVTDIQIGANGVITVTLGGSQGIATAVNGEDIVLTPNDTDPSRVDWTCTSTADDKYLPANCRAGAVAP